MVLLVLLLLLALHLFLPKPQKPKKAEFSDWLCEHMQELKESYDSGVLPKVVETKADE